jgi:hypothetical protein
VSAVVKGYNAGGLLVDIEDTGVSISGFLPYSQMRTGLQQLLGSLERAVEARRATEVASHAHLHMHTFTCTLSPAHFHLNTLSSALEKAYTVLTQIY